MGFSFLFAGDCYHTYYLHKLEAYTTGFYDPQLAPEPLAFKVKKAEEKETLLEQPSALPVEESGSDDEAEKDDEEVEEDQQDEEDDETPPLPPGEAPVTILKAEPQIYE